MIIPEQSVGNMFSNLPTSFENETFETILKSGTCKIERIVSMGHATPANDWYDQLKNEWVMVLRGAARLKFADSKELVDMKPGDHITIPAHCRHRVEWTAPNEITIWLAVFY